MDTNLNGKLELIIQFSYQEVVGESLAGLHDPYDSCIDLILSVLIHPLLSVYLFLLLQLTNHANMRIIIIYQSLKHLM